MAKKLSQSEFIERSNDIHGFKYDYSGINYVNIRTTIEITCKIHHSTFMQLPKSHLMGKSSCKQCTIEKKQQTCLENHGVANPSQSEKIKNKKTKTCLKNHGVEYGMQSNKIKEQTAATNLKRYGGVAPAHSDDVKQKIKQTNLNRRGVECPFQSEEVKEKIKKTCLDKFGVEYALQSEEVKEKSKQTCLKNYGVEYNMQSPINQEKSKQTCLETYGVEYSLQSEEIKNKSKMTYIELYGVDNPMKSPIIREKSRRTSIERFGVEYQAQRQIPIDVMDKLNNREWLVEQHHVKKITLEQISKNLDVGISTVPAYFRKHDIEIKYFFQSTGEREILEFIKQHYTGEIVSNSRKLIHPYEIDIYLPELNLAVEYNGTYWHCELNGKDRQYHLNKTKLCNEKGVQLIHIWEHDWESKSKIIKSIVLSKLNMLPVKLNARDCEVVLLNAKKIRPFIHDNHIQGAANTSINLALLYNNEIVSAMTFSKSRYTNNVQYELVRFVSRINTNVRGAASKLFSYFLKTYNPSSILSYSDIGRNKGNVYNILGFEYSHTSTPNFKYLNLNTMELSSRLKFQKHKLQKELKLYDESLSAWQNMQNNGYDRIWDCGNDVYVWGNE